MFAICLPNNRMFEGEMTFEEFNAVLEAEVKEDDNLELGVAQEEVRTATEKISIDSEMDTESTSKEQVSTPEKKIKKVQIDYLGGQNS